MNEKTLNTEWIYKGRIVEVRRDKVLLPNGRKAYREIIDHRPAVVVLPYNSLDEIYLIRQYRKPCEKILIEAPAGMMEDQEAPLVSAKRELREETGFSADEWQLVSECFPAPGFCNEYLYIYLAKGLHFGKTNMDEDESIELVKYTFEELKALIHAHEIVDAKTIIAFFYLQMKEKAYA